LSILVRNGLGKLLLRAAAEFPESKIKDALKFYKAEDFAASPARLRLKMAQLPAAK
jgi:hypothetical protein